MARRMDSNCTNAMPVAGNFWVVIELKMQSYGMNTQYSNRRMPSRL